MREQEHCKNHFHNQRPLQNAMRLVKVAIQLDTGNRHKVDMFKSLNL